MASIDMCEHDWPGSGCRQCFPNPTPIGEGAREIAGKLSPMTRDRLLGEENVDCPAGAAFSFVQHGLIEADPNDPSGWIWSPKGLAVRSLLASTQVTK